MPAAFNARVLLASTATTGRRLAMSTPPTIFAPQRRLAVRARLHKLQQRPGSARFLLDNMVDDVLERMAFVRCEPARALIIGDWTGSLAAALTARGIVVTQADPMALPGVIAVDEEHPLPGGPYDFIASLGTLDTVNDLPGALIHLRAALATGGLLIASFVGAGSLDALRAIMQAADGERAAPRLHPMVDVRAGAHLLQRCGFDDPVADGHALKARYRALKTLVADLRAQGVQNVLERHGPPLGKAGLSRATARFAELADVDGRVTETFEIVTLSGWRRR